MQNSKLKVFFDTNSLNKGHAVRGIGYYVRNLEKYLKNCKDIELVGSEIEADIVHYPYFDLFFNTLKVSSKPTVVTIFDTIPLIFPKNYPSGIKGKINLLKQKHELKKVDAVITISETSKKDIVRFLDVPEEKIYPIYLAPEEKFKKLKHGNWKIEIRKKYTLPEKFVLYVGDVNYNKNVCALADACVNLKIPLVIVGKQAIEINFNRNHIENREWAKLIDKYGENEFILRIGYVESDDLVKIYNLATVYCQPSLYEGFGLPVLEAQACGVPVVAYKTQVLVEIAGDSCLFVKDSSELKEKIELLYNSSKTRDKLVINGLDNVKIYTWKNTFENTLIVYKKIYV